MVHNEVVKRVNIHDAKTHLSHYLAELTPGETLAVSNRNQPVAELRLLRKKGVRKPRIGAARGAFVAGRLPGLHADPFDRMLVAQGVRN